MKARPRKFREADGLAIVRRHVPKAVARGLALVHHRNRRLWDLEDRVRATEDAETIAGLKREIDVANLARHKAVERIDAAVLGHYKRGLAAGQRGAVLDSCSVGQMLDRLSILVLKRARVAGPTAHAVITAQWAHAIASLDRAVIGLVTGKWVHHAAGEVKQYGRVQKHRRR